jgi:parvulin-like peptidyl-prolyl cis-trans isomerase-like protein
MYRPSRKGFSLALVGALACCAGGCGANRDSPTHAAGTTRARQPTVATTRTDASLGASLPTGAVARVGSQLISGSALERWLAERMRSLPTASRLLPPGFADCVAQLKEEPISPEGSGGEPAQLRKECLARYEAARRQGLEQAIAATWTLEAAREMGVSSDVATPVERLLGRARIDPRLLPAATSAAAAIHSAIVRSLRPVSAVDVAKYYAQHRDKYTTVPELRDVQLARTQTQARGNLAREELEGGKTFAQVVKESGVREADYSSNGLVLELRPTEYGEPNLNHAIFGAQPNELLGPIQTVYGFFVFEVRKVHPAHFKPLGEVAGPIREDLRRSREGQAIARFVASWHAKWTARTSCAGGLVVRGCPGFDADVSTELPGRLYSFG